MPGYHTFIYQPLYNGLVFLLAMLPFADAGVAVIVFTVIVKIVLYPLSKKAIITQLLMKEIQPEIDQVKEKYKNNKEEQARKIMQVYKERGVNPFLSIILIFIQIPIIFALYQVFNSGLPAINTAELYSFIWEPQAVSTTFLGLFDISDKHNIPLAALVGVSQFFQAWFMVSGQSIGKKTKRGTFESDFAHSMNLQMKYVLPVFLGIVSYNLSGALAIYWITSNLFAIGQELLLRRARSAAPSAQHGKQ